MGMRIEEVAGTLLAPALALAPACALAVDYMTPQQAQQAIFPNADVVQRVVALDAQQMAQLGQRLGVPARSARWQVLEASQGGKVLGWLVLDNVVGKFELITYAVGITVEGQVKQVEILSYRESHGGEVRLPAWRSQFVGKSTQAPLKVGQDIANLSGATLSCTHVTEGIKRIVGVIDLARQSHQLGA
jgi:Na+-translocating ferredoxin:NAD+ oxidoreductase RnfG subunit